jgi:uncharacterized protein YbcI
MTDAPVSDDEDGPFDGAAVAEELIQAAGGRPPADNDGAVRSALVNAMVAMKKRFYGRGPVAGKAWLLDDYAFVALEGGLTRNEETLLADGKEHLIRTYRLSFEETMSDATVGAVEAIVGRKVLSYHSQVVFEPTRSYEIFLLEPPSAG